MFCCNGVSAALMGFLLPNLDKKAIKVLRRTGNVRCKCTLTYYYGVTRCVQSLVSVNMKACWIYIRQHQ